MHKWWEYNKYLKGKLNFKQPKKNWKGTLIEGSWLCNVNEKDWCWRDLEQCEEREEKLGEWMFDQNTVGNLNLCSKNTPHKGQKCPQSSLKSYC